mmetsp:Transcript_2345/g.2288  ORF Transcript_2345/g.2288 Transcript_2345/m.2288 type:complete len:104 (+) Transcript_2345:474-785(+)
MSVKSFQDQLQVILILLYVTVLQIPMPLLQNILIHFLALIHFLDGHPTFIQLVFQVEPIFLLHYQLLVDSSLVGIVGCLELFLLLPEFTFLLLFLHEVTFLFV